MRVSSILVPMDFSEESRRALQEAYAFSPDAELTVLHVHQVAELSFLDFAYVEPPERITKVCEAAGAKARAWCQELGIPAARVQVEVATGTPVGVINERSAEFDLIVMGTHGRSGVQHFLLGSVAERVVQGAQCSVLIIKEGALAPATLEAPAT